LLAAGCASAAAQQVAQPSSPAIRYGVATAEPAADAHSYGAADTTFGLNLLGAWCRQDPQQNLLLSPVSMATGLGMAYLGARGATAQTMARVLQLPDATGQALLAGLQARTRTLASLDGAGVTLSQSNQVWADPSLKTNQSYLNALATGYQAGVAQVPLLTDPAQAAQRIDQTISAATRGQIQHLVNAGMLQGLGWLLTSALYLNATWATKFQVSDTYPQPFTTASGQTVNPQFLHGGGYQVATADGWTGVTLPYQDGKVEMVALLPPASGAGCAMPGTSALTAIAGHGSPGSIAMPKLKLSSAGSFTDLLSGLGMGIAFGPSADFTGISSQAGPIGLVQQDATLQVTEKGTVAAAATAVGIVAASAPVQRGKVVTFNRPYLLLITSAATGEPLFLVRVANPADS
jgi:serpin B